MLEETKEGEMPEPERHETRSARTPPDRDPRRDRGPAPPPPPKWRNWFVVAALVAWALILFVPSIVRSKPPTSLSYSQFVSRVESNRVKTATINSTGGVSGTLTNGTRYTSQIPTALNDNKLSTTLQDHHVQITAKSSGGVTFGEILANVLPLLLLVGLWIWIGRRGARQLAGGLGGVLGSKAKLYDAEKPSTTFNDVAGYEGAKLEVMEVVDFLKNPDRYKRAGAIGPRGILLVGPPGTGKTLMARAVAGEADVPFLSASGSSFIEVFVGVGASRVRDMFSTARKRAPSIIFIDEIDAIGQRRGGAVISNDEREQTLNQLLAEMDGFDPSTGVVVMAATNRPETLDPALLRPGRFDRQVEIPLPNLKEREAIIRVHSKGRRLRSDVELQLVARATPGFSGADLANLVNEAAIVAVRDGRAEVTPDDFSEARDRILLGRREATNALLPDERRAVAVHEAGHALVAVLSPNADPVEKVTILPAGHALGVTQQLPVDDRHLYGESYLLDSLAIRMGGRAAERMVVGEISSGASNDLASATELATRMVREFGMSEKLGPVGYASNSPAYLGTHELTSRDYAEATQRLIDEEVARFLREADERATELLTKNRAALDKLVDMLLQRETVDGPDVRAIVDGETPFGKAAS
jgi:cell division protease FtsH